MFGINNVRNNLQSEKDNGKLRGKGNISKDELIKDYIPFITSVVSKVTGKFIDTRNSDEFSIGLLAFSEAIDCYNKNKQKNFLNFSEQVIRRRIIDYLRNNNKNNIVYPFSYLNVEDSEDFEDSLFRGDSNNDSQNIEMKQEILLYEQNLKGFGIELEELVECSPKHRDSKQLCIQIARELCNSDKLFNKLYLNKKLPIEALMKTVNVSRRTIERNRKFIIAVCLILKSDLTILKYYVNNVKEEDEQFE